MRIDGMHFHKDAIANEIRMMKQGRGVGCWPKLIPYPKYSTNVARSFDPEPIHFAIAYTQPVGLQKIRFVQGKQYSKIH